jgi:hypothetical protein
LRFHSANGGSSVSGGTMSSMVKRP